jgi:hypothetical protein
MRKLLMLGAATVMAVSLGACATDPTTGLPTIDQNTLNSVEAQIQTTAANVCKFEPTIASVAGVIASFVSAGAVVDLVNQAAQSICTAVANAPVTPAKVGHKTVMRLTQPVTANGVKIDGYFMK